MPEVMFTPEVLVRVPGRWVSMLEEAGFDVRYPEDATFTRGVCGIDETIRVLKNASAVIAGGEHFTPEVIEALPNLRVIARAGVGYDRVDVAAASKRGIAVTITPTANHESVAETVFALIFAIAKNVIANDHRVRIGKWDERTTQPVRSKTLGLFGLGRIGKSTAIRARAMGMHVLATETYPDLSFVQQHHINIVPFDELLAQSDYLSVHCPLTSETNAMFNSSVFARMKKGSAFINTARGGLVVEKDLHDALHCGHLAAAGLDVFEVEPAPIDNPLFQLKNVVLMPHLGGADWLSLTNMAIEAADCIVKLSMNQWPTGAVVNDQLQNDWRW
jgi:D-3-phosphoglycerate dehydrogenase / 2-oxoglutarate reductase